MVIGSDLQKPGAFHIQGTVSVDAAGEHSFPHTLPEEPALLLMQGKNGLAVGNPSSDAEKIRFSTDGAGDVAVFAQVLHSLIN